jgi:sigma-B regulation protein RsbU (phosphoserine phosphatase)
MNFSPSILLAETSSIISWDNGHVGFYVGDVSGKGLPAAMYAALAVEILRSVHKTDESPSDILSALHRRLMGRGGLRRHAAIIHGVFYPLTPELQLASAGMSGPFYFSEKVDRSWIYPVSRLFPDWRA